MQPQLTVYTRRGCHLCEDMTRALARLAPELGFRVREVDIDRDRELQVKYDERVPVLVAGDTELSHYFLDLERLRAWCEAANTAGG